MGFDGLISNDRLVPRPVKRVQNKSNSRHVFDVSRDVFLSKIRQLRQGLGQKKFFNGGLFQVLDSEESRLLLGVLAFRLRLVFLHLLRLAPL